LPHPEQLFIIKEAFFQFLPAGGGKIGIAKVHRGGWSKSTIKNPTFNIKKATPAGEIHGGGAS
jgi:hypothetical protein